MRSPMVTKKEQKLIEAQERRELRTKQTETGHFLDRYGKLIRNQCKYHELSENGAGLKVLTKRKRDDYIAELDVLQVRDPETEPVQCSLVHAFNNAVGIRGLLSAADLFNARDDLVLVARAQAVRAYFGTNDTGPGDWPVEVLQAAIADKFAPGNLVLKKCGYKVQGEDISTDRIYMAVVGYARMRLQLLCELQLPVPAERATSEKAPGDELWDLLPVSPAGERTHFIAVRNGLVYDSMRAGEARPVPVSEYPHWARCKRMHRVVVDDTNRPWIERMQQK